jgi:integral membrane sensor domain MASE1
MKTGLTVKQVRRHLKNTTPTDYRSYLVKVGLLALIYVVTAKLGLSLAYSTQQVTTVWPPTGIALASLLLLGYRYWPGIFFGAFVANAFTDETLLVASGIAIGNTLEALIGAYLLKRFIRFDPTFSRITDFLGLVVFAGILSTAVSATIGTLSLMLGGIISGQAYFSTWRVWWVGDMMGALIFATLILITIKNGFGSLRSKPVEASVLIALCIAACAFVFSQNTSSVSTLPYIIFPLIMWASIRFTQAGAVAVITVTAAIAIWGTLHNRGPFTTSTSVDQNVILLHTFLLVMISAAMVMAIVAFQRQRVENTLRERTEELQEANRRVMSLLAGAVDQPAAKLRAKVLDERAKAKLVAKK